MSSISFDCTVGWGFIFGSREMAEKQNQQNSD